MKTDNLTRACRSLDLVSKALEQAHADSAKCGDGFADDIFSVLEATLKLEVKLHLIARAATDANAAKKKESK